MSQARRIALVVINSKKLEVGFSRHVDFLQTFFCLVKKHAVLQSFGRSCDIDV